MPNKVLMSNQSRAMLMVFKMVVKYFLTSGSMLQKMRLNGAKVALFGRKAEKAPLHYSISLIRFCTCHFGATAIIFAVFKKAH